MKDLIINNFRGIKRKFLQYLGIFILIVIATCTIGAVYANNANVKSVFYDVREKSNYFNYSLNLTGLKKTKDLELYVSTVKAKIKKVFAEIENLEEKAHIYNFIDNDLKELDIINNNYINDVQKISGLLYEYFTNWNFNFDAIYLDNLFSTELANYDINSCFIKNFLVTESNPEKIYYYVEDAFYDPQKNASLNNFDFFADRNGINKVVIISGRAPLNETEVIINPIFAQENNVKIGNEINILGRSLRVSGVGYSYWGSLLRRSLTNLYPTIYNTTQVFTYKSIMREFLTTQKVAENYFIRIYGNDTNFENNLQVALNQHFTIPVNNFLIPEINEKSSGILIVNINLQDILYLSISLIVSAVILFIILFYVRKEIELQKRQIGIFKAMGMQNYKIAVSIATLFLILVLSSIFFGLVLSLPMQYFFSLLSQSLGLVLKIHSVFLDTYELIFSLAIIPIFFFIVIYLYLSKRLQYSALDLINDRKKDVNIKYLGLLKKPFEDWSFKPRLTMSFAVQSFSKLLLVFFTFIFITFLLIFETVSTDIFDNKINNFYSFFDPQVKSFGELELMYGANNNKIDTKTKFYEWVQKDNLLYEKQINYNDIVHQKALSDLIIRILKSDSYQGWHIKDQDVTELYKGLYVFNDVTKTWEFNQELADQTFSDFDDDKTPLKEIVIEILKSEFMKMNLYLPVPLDLNVDGVYLPGIIIGDIVLDEGTYPNLKLQSKITHNFNANNWNLVSDKRKKVTIQGIYDRKELPWTQWFNFESKENLQDIFYPGHAGPIGKREVDQELISVIPVAISQTIATLNNYSIDDEFLLEYYWGNDVTFKIVCSVKGIVTNNVDVEDIYCNYETLLQLTELPEASFNNILVGKKSFFPSNYLSFFQHKGDYSKISFLENYQILLSDFVILDIVKSIFSDTLDTVLIIVNITKYMMLIGVTFALIIIVNMILDNNATIIVMMKSFGYRINEINLLIIGFYILSLIVAFFIGTILAYLIWNIILHLISFSSGIILQLPLRIITIISSFILAIMILFISYFIGIFFIKYKSLNKLLQKE